MTGLVESLGTKWGSLRHWWVLISLGLTVLAMVVLVVETGAIVAHAAFAADPTATNAELRELDSTLATRWAARSCCWWSC